MSGMLNPLPESNPTPAAPAAQAKSGMLWKVLLIAGLVVVGGGILYSVQAARQKQADQAAAATLIKTVTVHRGDLEQRLRITGQTSARDFANVVAPQLRGPEAGPMVLLKVAASGILVRKGDVVAEFDPQSMKDHLDDTIDGLRDKENDVKKKKVNNDLQMENLRQTLRQAKANVDKAKLDFQAAEIRTEIDREVLKLNLEEAEATYKEKLADVSLSEQSQAADLRSTEILKKVEDLHVERHQKDIVKLVVRAPMDGMVVLQTMNRPGGEQVTLAVGDRMGPGQPIMKVINPNKMQVEGTVNQSETSQLRIGQDAKVGLDAFPDAQYTGKVYAIGALAVGSRRENYYIRNVPVRVEVMNADSRMIPDLSAASNVLLQAEKDVIVAPLSAVEQLDGKSYVQIKTPKGFERREVKLGSNNGVQVAILEGLKDGDTIRTN